MNTSLRAIRNTVVTAYGLSPQQLLSTSIARPVVEARHVGMFLARELTDASLDAISRTFGRARHNSASYAIERTERRVARSATFRKRVADIRRAVETRRPAAHADAQPGTFTRGPSAVRMAVRAVLDADDARSLASDAEGRKTAATALEEALKGLRAAFEGSSREARP